MPSKVTSTTAAAQESKVKGVQKVKQFKFITVEPYSFPSSNASNAKKYSANFCIKTVGTNCFQGSWKLEPKKLPSLKSVPSPKTTHRQSAVSVNPISTATSSPQLVNTSSILYYKDYKHQTGIDPTIYRESIPPQIQTSSSPMLPSFSEFLQGIQHV